MAPFAEALRVSDDEAEDLEGKAYPLFDFESNFVATLRCIPMAVRFKLDACGIKLSLRHWSRLTLNDRHELRVIPCETEPEVAAYRDALIERVATRTGEEPKPLPAPAEEAWRDLNQVPAPLNAFAGSLGVGPLTPSAWKSLTALERFALIKLSRDNHDNVNFLPALREFGLL
jgi:hypothetical protein